MWVRATARVPDGFPSHLIVPKRISRMAALIDRFIGHHNYSLDAKGRVSIPADFREVLSERYDDKLVLMKHYDRCLVAYPVDEWNKLDAALAELAKTNPQVIKFKRMYYSSAKVCELDAQGRVLVPPALKEYAGLGREVALVGMGERIELWDPETYLRENAEADSAAIRDAVAAIGF